MISNQAGPCLSMNGVVLLLLSTALQVEYLLCQPQFQLTKREELAQRVVNSSCGAQNLTNFYLNIREQENVERKFPLRSTYDKLAGTELHWGDIRSHYLLLPWHYDDFANDYSNSHPQNRSYKWCVYLAVDADIHACLTLGEEPTFSPGFKELGLLDYLTLRDASPDFDFLSSPAVSLEIAKVNTENYIVGNSLWNKALISLTIDWLNPDITPVGQYFIMNTYTFTAQYIIHFPSDESFLVEGEYKEFSCEVYGLYQHYLSAWRHGNGSDVVNVWPPYPLKDNGVDARNTFQFVDDCKIEASTDSTFILGTDTMNLTFHNPHPDELGEYVCYIWNRDTGEDFEAKSLFIYVMFIDIFSNTELLPQQSGQLQCTVKAPTGAVVTVWHEGRILDQPYDPLTFHENCSHNPVTSQSSVMLDDQFSLFTVTIHICRVDTENGGEYACRVNYSIPTKPNASVVMDTTIVVHQNKSEPMKGSLSTGGAVGIGLTSVAVAVFLISVIAVSLFILTHRVTRQRKMKRSFRTHLNNLPSSFCATNPFGYKVAPSTDGMEFKRSNLEFHEQLGKGRFGIVFLATAYNIAPYDPTLNKVAVKKAISSTSQSDKIVRGELEIMKRLKSDENICNLLAYCTKDGPVLIIMEYANHGNLKEFLDLCRQTVEQSGGSPSILNNEIKAPRYFTDCKASFVDDKKPGLISESMIRNFAHQIACGLEHIQSMDVVHCDLAARNVLISENFVLKISDFGMAKTLMDKETVIDLDGIVAVKWAALEVLENKGYKPESDIWSYAVTIWEIASYGCRPFSDQKIGLSMEKFVQFLKAGNRLPQPTGLSKSVFEQLLSCWSADASARPSSTSLRKFFSDYS